MQEEQGRQMPKENDESKFNYYSLSSLASNLTVQLQRQLTVQRLQEVGFLLDLIRVQNHS